MDNLTHLDDPLIKVLLQEKQFFWTTNSHRSDEERHRLWAQRAHQLTSVLEPETLRIHNGSSTTSPRRSQANVPRSVSYGASSAQALASADLIGPDLTRDWSQRSAPAAVPMSRKRSSASQHGHTFLSYDPSVPPLAIADFETSHDEPFSNYTLGNASKLRRTGSQRIPLPRVPEVAVYDNPEDWYSRASNGLDNRPSPSFDSSPTVCCSEHRHEQAPRLSPLVKQAVAGGNIMQPPQSPSTPTTGELTSGTTLASSMSRQHSLASTDFCLDFSDMLRVESRISSCSNSGIQSPLDLSPSLMKGNEDGIGLPSHDQVLQYTGGIVDDVHFSPPFSSVLIEAPLLQSSSAVEENGMLRSHSDESNTSASASSNHLKAARRRSEHLTYASRPIAPKHPDNRNAASSYPPSEHKMLRIQFADGPPKDVAMIPKATYQRPAHPRVKCPRCDERPEGFKGEHELRRHVDRAHGILRKTWVTVDISPDHKFLASCKACRTGKKYNAYYNAAAHLRRTHFNPRKRGRGAKGKNEEKRGGKGGGDHPSMDVLKMWMKEVEEVVLDNMPLSDGSGEADDNATLDESYAYPAALPMQTTYSNDSSNNGFSDQYHDTQAFDSPPSFDDAMHPSQAPLVAADYDNAPLQSLEQFFDEAPLDFVNTFPDELIPFIDPLYSSAVSNLGQQTHAGLGGSDFFTRM